MSLQNSSYIILTALILMLLMPLSLYSQAGPGELSPAALVKEALMLIHKSDYDSAAACLNQAESLIDRMETEKRDSALIVLADAYYSLAENQRRARRFHEAYTHHNKALSIRIIKLPGDSPDLGNSYYYSGVIDFILGRYNEGMEHLYNSLAVRQRAFGENSAEVSDSYNMLGTFYSVLDQYSQAETYYNLALAIRLAYYGEKHSEVASSYNNLGIVARQRGDYETSLEYYYKAVDIRRAVDGEEHPLIAQNYSNIASVFASMDRLDEAIEYEYLALEIRKNAYGERDIETARFYNNLGVFYRTQGSFDKALYNLQKALDLRLDMLGERNSDVAQTKNNLGVVYYNTGNYEKALEYLYSAAGLRREIFGEYNTSLNASLTYIADVYKSLGEYRKAIGYYRKGIAAQVPGYNPDYDTGLDLSLLESAILNTSLLNSFNSKARVYRLLYDENNDDPGHLDYALRSYNAAGRVIDLLRDSYSEEQSKLFLAESSHDIYEHAQETSIVLYQATGRPEYVGYAYEYAERSRAMVLWSAILDSRAQSFAGIPEDILKHERSLNRDLVQARIRYHRARSETDAFNTLRNEYFEKWQEYSRFKQEIENNFPRYHNLRYDRYAFSHNELQRVLSMNTALIQYSLGNDASYVFIITADSLHYRALPSADLLKRKTEKFRRTVRRLETESFSEQSRELHTMLVEPVGEIIRTKERLIIIPDGPLNYLPFESLLSKSANVNKDGTDFSSLPYLINDYIISYHYSGKLAAESLTAVDTGKFSDISAGRSWFSGFAPVFSGFGGFAGGTRDGGDDNESDIHGMTDITDFITELPHSREEVQSIVGMFGEAGISASGFFENEATREMFFRYAAKSRIIHIASHGFFNESKPMLSAILFSGGKQGAIAPLYAGEMYGLSFSADLAVLSSCESGLGTVIRGEGMMAMTRGMLYAGVQNVIVSLWKVTDRHTKDLMSDMYRSILNEEGYAEALRSAKLSMIKNPASSHPVFWSGFVMIGK